MRKAIPQDSVLIEIARFRVARPAARGGEKEWDAPRYVAWVIPATGTGRARLVDLGEAEAIEAAVKAVRQVLAQAGNRLGAVGEPKAEEEAGAALQRLARLVFHPLLPHIGQARQLILSPDGALWLVPWSALPLLDGKYAIEKFAISHAISGRDLAQPSGKEVKPAEPLVLANPDFNLTPDEAGKLDRGQPRQPALPRSSLAGRKGSGRLGRWEIEAEFRPEGVLVMRGWTEQGEIHGRGRWRLEGNQVWAEMEQAIYQAQLQGDRLSGERRYKDGAIPAESKWSLILDRPGDPRQVREDNLRSTLRLGKVDSLPYTAVEAEQITPALEKYSGTRPRVLTDKEALVARVQSARSPRVLVLCTHGFFLADESNSADRKKSSRIENPLLRCGLLLAGCNNANQAREGQNTGVLTGLEIIGCELHGCELVVLSACETGLGDVRNGEGVAGLRQAFQLAGAQCVAATLWQIPDQASAQLMIRFWENLAAGQSKPEALRNAQLSTIKARRDRNAAAHPFFWAAFTLTGTVK